MKTKLKQLRNLVLTATRRVVAPVLIVLLFVPLLGAALTAPVPAQAATGPVSAISNPNASESDSSGSILNLFGESSAFQQALKRYYQNQNKKAPKNFHQIDSTDAARRFFGSSGSDDHLYFRNTVGNSWQTLTIPGGGSDKVSNLVKQKNGKPTIQVFRKPAPFNDQEYQNPFPFDHRNLTLAYGVYSESGAFNEAIKGYLSDSTGAAGLSLATGGASGGLLTKDPGQLLSDLKGAFEGVANGADKTSTWVFVGEGNNAVQNTLTCNKASGFLGKGNDEGSRFIFKDSKPVITAGTVSEITDDDRIANIDRIRSGRPQEFDKTPLAEYLCSTESEKDFLRICETELDLGARNCDSTVEGVMESLGDLFDPLGWALGVLEGIVQGFVGFVTDGLREITDIGALANTSGVASAWKVMRDLVNLIFILVLVVIAFSNILRIDTEKYGARALLPRLIFAIIGVNFSLLIVTIVINVATIVGNPFLSGLNVLTENNPVTNQGLLGAGGSTAQRMISIIAGIAVGVVLLILLLMFVARIVMIWILAALAPFAFLFSVLPFTRSLSKQWLKELLKWVFLAPIAFAVLWIGARFLTAADSLDATILSVLIFIGVVIAAVMIPYRLGGEVMQRAVGSGKGLGKGAARLGLGSLSKEGRKQGLMGRYRTGKQMLDQRAQTQEGTAARQAAVDRSEIAEWGGGTGARGAMGRLISGGTAAEVGLGRARAVAERAKEFDNKGKSKQALIAMALGDRAGMVDAGLTEELGGADDPIQQEAAGSLLAEKHLLFGDEGRKIMEQQAGLGLHSKIGAINPVLAAANWEKDAAGKRRLMFNDRAIDSVEGKVGSLKAGDGKDVLWGEVIDHAVDKHGGGPQEMKAGRTAFHSVPTAVASGAVDISNPRTLIEDDKQRIKFVEGIERFGSDANKSALRRQFKVNEEKVKDNEAIDLPMYDSGKGGSSGGIITPGSGTGPGGRPYRPRGPRP